MSRLFHARRRLRESLGPVLGEPVLGAAVAQAEVKNDTKQGKGAR